MRTVPTTIPRRTRVRRSLLSTLLIAVVVTVALIPIAGAQAATGSDTATSTSESANAPSDETSSMGDTSAETPTTTLAPTTTTTLPAPSTQAPVVPVPDSAPIAKPVADDHGADGLVDDQAGIASVASIIAQPSGTITVHKGGVRANPAGTDNGLNYAAGLQNAVFEYSPNGSAPWTELCTTDAAGDCTSATVAPGTYTVREKSAPAGWSTIGQLTYGGDSSGSGNQSHAYVGTVTVGLSGTATPSVQNSNNSGDRNTPHRFVNVKDDKPLPAAQCGIKVAMILDISGSIGRAPSSPTIYKNAANSFVAALSGTPTTLTRIVKFSDGAAIQSPGTFPINLQTNAADAKTQIDNIYNAGVGGGTNWDAALKLMSGSGADIVVMVTDGNPTTWDGAPNGGGSNIRLTDLEAGIASANSLKSESTILAVGVGNAPAVTATNLAAISGPGFFFTASLTEIQQELKDLANQLCGSRLHVRKLVDSVPTDNWTFSSTATAANVSYPKGQLTGLGGNAAGEMQVNLDNVAANGATDVSVLEDLAGKTGFSVQGTKCQLGSYPDQAAAIANGTANARSIGTVQRNQDWYCTFVNHFSSAPAMAVTQIHNGNDHSTDVTTVPLGSTVHDQATVTGSGFGTPTGSVAFSWFTGTNDCTGDSVPAGTVDLVNGVAHASTAFGPLATGNYSFLAHYNGSAFYDATDAACEPLSVTKANTSAVTAIHIADDHDTSVTTAPLGSTVHDSATVTGNAFGTPTGTVTFNWYTATSNCTGASVPAGAIVLVNGVAHASDAFGPLAAGSYSFRASYSGDANYNASTAACEPLTIGKANTSAVTAIHRGNNHDGDVTSVPLGSTVHDQATVTGTGFGTPTGTVTFTWFTTAADCSGASVAAGTITLDHGVAHPSTAFGPLAAGSYSFLATYNGDADYDASTAGCEPLTVGQADSSTATTIHDAATHDAVTTVRLGTTVHDEATVTGMEFATPTGNVSFRWYTNDTCSGESVEAGIISLANGVAHPSDSETPPNAGGFAFRATYNGDANYRASLGPCEPLTVTAVDLSITKTDGGAEPVAGDGTFTYTLGVDNLGPSDASVDATVVDVLPSEIVFSSFGPLADGVTCAPPVGQTVTCTIVSDLLHVDDSVVTIPIVVSVAAGTTAASVTNRTIVTSPDDEAPCTVTATDITCDPTDTNNYAQVVTPIATVAGVVVTVPGATPVAAPAPAPARAQAQALAFTGFDSGLLLLFGALFVGMGAFLLLASRRRKQARFNG